MVETSQRLEKSFLEKRKTGTEQRYKREGEGMKYRIITNDNDLLPYTVQRKNEHVFLSFWRTVIKCKAIHEAESYVKRFAERHSKHPIGTVVLEYDESDLVVDRLKNQGKHDEIGMVMAEAQQSAKSPYTLR
jgi:hypothetical protein